MTPTPALDWDDLKVFLAIARAGSLGGAAAALGSTQPTMGRRLRAFEARLGIALFQRSREGFHVTDDGLRVLAHAERMEEEALAFQRQLSGGEALLRGRVRVSSSDWFGAHVLAPVFGRFQKRHPEVAIELVTDARLLSLARREADLVFRHLPFEDADVVQRRLMRIDYGLYGAKGLKRPRAGDGLGAPLVTLDDAFSGMPDAQWLRRLLPRAHVALQSNDRDVQAAWCASGNGWAVLPCLLARRVPGLRRVDLGEAPPAREMFMGYHQDLRRLARLRSLVDHVVAELAPGATSP